jgi:hypothetical protein
VRAPSPPPPRRVNDAGVLRLLLRRLLTPAPSLRARRPQAQRTVLTAAGFGARAHTTCCAHAQSLRCRCAHALTGCTTASSAPARAGAFMAIYTASIHHIEQARKGKRDLVRAPSHTHTSPLCTRALARSLTMHSLFPLRLPSQANSLLAGCITGAVLAVHTRKAPVVALSAAISGVLMLGVDGAGAVYNTVVAAQQQQQQQQRT